MELFEFTDEVVLPKPPSEIFPFFGDAGNLNFLTPPWLNFEIITPQPMEMRAGAIIDYRLRVHGVPLRWRTLIREWEPPFRFVDEQIRGPYRLWVHEHTFTPQGDSTLARDHVRYSPVGGWIMNRLFVRRDIERIFAFRTAALRRQFLANRS